MSVNNKDANLKEKLKQALNSTFKVISDNYNSDKIADKKSNFFELDSLNTINDFIKVCIAKQSCL